MSRPYGKNRQPIQVSLFPDNLTQIEWLIDRGYAGNRSEVIRKLIAEKVEELKNGKISRPESSHS